MPTTSRIKNSRTAHQHVYKTGAEHMRRSNSAIAKPAVANATHTPGNERRTMMHRNLAEHRPIHGPGAFSNFPGNTAASYNRDEHKHSRQHSSHKALSLPPTRTNEYKTKGGESCCSYLFARLLSSPGAFFALSLRFLSVKFLFLFFAFPDTVLY